MQKWKLLEIEYENYCGFRKKLIDLRDIKGTIALLGENGSGKSTFLDTFALVYYGKTNGKVTLGDLVNTDAKEENPNAKAKVSILSSSPEGILYRVTRIISSKGTMETKFHINDELYSKKKGEVQEEILNLLRVPFPVLELTAYAVQKKVANFYSLSNAEKKKFFDVVLDIGFEQKIEKIKKYSTLFEKMLFKKDYQRKVLKDYLDEQTNKKSFLEKEITDLSKEKIQKKLKDLQEEYNTLEAKSKDFELIDNLKKEIINLEDQINYSSNKLKNYSESREKVLNLKESLKNANQELNLVIKETSPTKKENVTSKITIAESFFSEKNHQLEIIENNIQSFQDKIVSLNEQLAGLIQKKESFSDDSICPTCGQTVKDAHADKVHLQKNKINEEISLLNEDKKKQEENLSAKNAEKIYLSNLIEKAEEKYKTLKTLLEEYNKSNEERRNRSSKVKILRKKISGYKTSLSNISSIEILDKDIDVTKQNINSLEKQLTPLKEKLISFGENSVDYDKLLTEKETEINSEKDKLDQYNKNVSIIEDINKELVEKNKLFLKKEELVARLKERLDKIQKFKEDLNKSFGEYSLSASKSIFAIQNSILTEIHSGLNVKPLVEVKKNIVDYDFEFYKNNTKVPFGLISGGQETILGCALRSALWKFISITNPNPISFLILDEVFEGLSPVNSGLMFNYLSSLNKYFDYVFITSHSDHIFNTQHKIYI